MRWRTTLAILAMVCYYHRIIEMHKGQKMDSYSIAGNDSKEFQKTVSVKLKELSKEMQSLGNEIETLQNRQAKVAQLIAHLEGVLELSDVEHTSATMPVLRQAHYSEICDLVEKILAERRKKPMHFRELADEVQRRGIELGGADPGRTLVAKMVWDPRFVRPTKRGFYALREDYPDVRNVGERKSRSKAQQKHAGRGGEDE